MKEKIIKRIKGPSVTFEIKQVSYRKRSFKVNIVDIPRTVGILAYFKNKIILVKQFRFPLKKETLEIPAGKVEKNETPERAAKRELLEETGFIAKNLEKIGQFYPTPGYSNEVLSLFRAKNLNKSKQKMDEDEFIKEIRFLNIKKALSLIKKGKIEDGKTILAIFFELFLRA